MIATRAAVRLLLFLLFVLLAGCGGGGGGPGDSNPGGSGGGAPPVCTGGLVLCDDECVDLASPDHCGSCDNACRGDQVCRAGSCVCPRGSALCGGVCTGIVNDPNNCGACGNVCDGALSCVDGECKKVCPTGQIVCGDDCVDPTVDTDNCGACGNRCAVGASCVDRACTCPEPTEPCADGLCVDTGNDPRNCGGCGIGCGTDERCIFGACTLQCHEGELLCDGACVDPLANAANCGECGHACAPGNACVAGACVDTPLPDLSVDAAVLATSVSIDHRTFETSSCAVVEGCVGGTGDRRLLRFSTRTPNHGLADLNVGPPAGNPNLVWSPCHGHYHFSDYASYRVLDLEGNVVATGHKQAFCLMDTNRVDPEAPHQSPHYTCSNQGISQGWADTYGSGLDCQWVDVTDLAPGHYQLEVSVNPAHVFAELDYSDNVVRIPVDIPTDAGCMPSPEVCGNGVDEDCTGIADDGCPPITGNEDCATAHPIRLNGTVLAQVDTTTRDDVTSSCGAAGGKDLVFRIDVQQTELVYLSTFGSTVPTTLSLRAGSCGGTETACVDDACSTQQEQWVGELQPGTYYAVVEAHGVTGPSTIQFKVQQAGCTGSPITSGTTVHSTTTGRTNTYSACRGGAAPEEAWWFTTCPGTRSAVATTCAPGTVFDTVVSVLPGSCTAPSVACADDDPSCSSGSTRTTLNAVPVNGDGLWFTIVDGYNAIDQGAYDLTVTW